ncbi:thiazole biosynthesis protein [Escherichia coli]
MPEYCGVISKSPTGWRATSRRLKQKRNSTSAFSIKWLKKRITLISAKSAADRAGSGGSGNRQWLGPNDVILDIRSIDEQEDKPLKVEGIDVVSLPFYKLSTKFGDLDQNRTWLLWCERGVMSRLALYLREQGFNNVKVYRP